MEYHSYQDRAQSMYERSMELVYAQVDNVKSELEQLLMLVDEIEENELRENIGKQGILAMSYLDKI